jgi:penicillin-binding protein 2
LVKAARKKSEGLRRFKPTLLLSDLDFSQYARIESVQALGQLPGIAVFDSIKRRYIYNQSASHLLGFVNEASVKDLQRGRGIYRSGDKLGRRGLERVYEQILRGRDGIERFVVDAKGRRLDDSFKELLIGDYGNEEPMAGYSLVLSMDREMQRTAEESFMGQAGSVIAIDPKTGFVLALASMPAYDPNWIIGPKNRSAMKALSVDPLKPWINRAIQEHYAPGSTFKAITAIAGLEYGLINSQSQVYCPGIFHLGKASWRCFKREGHGDIAMVRALKESCDVYFYRLGLLLGPDRLAATSRLLGFGRITGIDLDQEIPGIIPDQAYYKKRLGYYAPGLVVNSAIGQGDVTVTPMQLALAYTAMVNGGTIYTPQLVHEVMDPSGHVVEQRVPKVAGKLHEAAAELVKVKEGLAYVMDAGGTANGVLYRKDLPRLTKWLRESGVRIGGKTGTAQVVKLSKFVKHTVVEETAYLERDHSWFVGFAPVEDPEIVVVVMTEHGGLGGRVSAPVAASMIQTFYEKVRGKGRYEHLKKKGATSVAT